MKTKLEKHADKLWKGYPLLNTEVRLTDFWTQYFEIVAASKQEIQRVIPQAVRMRPMNVTTAFEYLGHTKFIFFRRRESDEEGDFSLSPFIGFFTIVLSPFTSLAFHGKADRYVLLYALMYAFLFGLIQYFYFYTPPAKVIEKYVLIIEPDSFTCLLNDSPFRIAYRDIREIKLTRREIQIIRYGYGEERIYRIPLYDFRFKRLPYERYQALIPLFEAINNQNRANKKKISDENRIRNI